MTVRPASAINVFVLKRLAAALMVIVVALCAGCMGNSYPPVPESMRNIDVDYDYVLGPGDSVKIYVWGNEDLSSSGTIRPDGKLTTKLVEDLQASGKTSTELARDIERAYSEYVREPVVSVTAGGFGGVPEQAIRVMGEAVSPKRVAFKKHMTLLDLMVSVGGLTQYADGNNSVLVRMVEGKQRTYSLKLDDLVRKGDISANLNMMPGDIIIIAEVVF
jgi:polysaccharide biosynthesis/export protein